MTALSSEAANFGWLLDNFVRTVPGTRHTLVVSADGLLMAMSDNLDRSVLDPTQLGQAVDADRSIGGRRRSTASADEARRERDQLLKEGQAMAAHIVEQAKTTASEEAARVTQQARESIQQEKNQALAEVRNTAAQLSVDIAERLLRRELANPAAQQQLVDEYLKDVKLN